MGEVDALARLRKFVDKYPTKKAAAAALGISQPYLTDLLYMRRDLSVAMLAKLGLKRVTVPR